MKSTDELKDKIEAAETIEEKKGIDSAAGMELSDDEIEGIAGGIRRRDRISEEVSRLPGW